MTMQEVCDAWLDELATSVTELANAKLHRYASWSPAAIADSAPGRHLALWPEGDPESRRPVTSDGGDLVTTSYIVSCWEGATAEAERVFDDDAANAAWMALYEAVKARFYLRANLSIGDPGSDVHYEGGRFRLAGGKRIFTVRFTKRNYETFT